MEIARTLTSGASGPPPDSSRHLWTPITIRVAWELVRAGVRPKGAVLQEAREHVLSLLPSQASLSDADLIAIDGTKDFVRRIQDIYQPWRPDPDLSIQPEARWRRDIQAALQPAHDVVFRLHFADVEDGERAWVGPVPVTTPIRTLHDCQTAHVAPDLLAQAVRDGLARGQFSRADLARFDA